MSNEINEINNIADPFDEALEDNYKSVFIDISTGKLFTTILPHLVSEMQVVILRLSLLLLLLPSPNHFKTFRCFIVMISHDHTVHCLLIDFCGVIVG